MTRSAPPNPQAAAARAAMQAHMSEVGGQTATPPKRTALYPLDCKLPIVYMECHDDGVSIWTDDVAALYAMFK